MLGTFEQSEIQVTLLLPKCQGCSRVHQGLWWFGVNFLNSLPQPPSLQDCGLLTALLPISSIAHSPFNTPLTRVDRSPCEDMQVGWFARGNQGHVTARYCGAPARLRVV